MMLSGYVSDVYNRADGMCFSKEEFSFFHREMPVYLSVKILSYENLHNRLLNEVWGFIGELNAPGLTEEKYHELCNGTLESLKNKKKDLVDYKSLVLSRLDKKEEEGIELIKTYHPDDWKPGVKIFREQFDEYRTMLDMCVIEIPEPQEMMDYIY